MYSNPGGESLDDRTSSQQDHHHHHHQQQQQQQQQYHHDHQTNPTQNGYHPDQRQEFQDNRETMSNFLMKSVNLNQVRTMIAQHLPEFIIICVIIIYLVYYFSQISRRPKLIGHSRSKFVEFVKLNLSKTIRKRFSPLIYFWGTNPQTALFGYLQGQTSINEVPRSKFKRQFLYVNDAQYLASNVDLSQHYSVYQQAKTRKTATSISDNKHHYQNRLVQLNASQLLHYDYNYLPNKGLNANQQQLMNLSTMKTPAAAEVESSSLLNQNIRIALNNILNNEDERKFTQHDNYDFTYGDDEQTSESDSVVQHGTKNLARDTLAPIEQASQQSVLVSTAKITKLESTPSCESDRQSIDEKRLSSNDFNSSSSSGSSSDSGVFASRSHSTTSSASSSSGSSLTIDMPSGQDSGLKKGAKKSKGANNSTCANITIERCNCSALYETDLHQYLEPPNDFDQGSVVGGIQESSKQSKIFISDTDNSKIEQQQQLEGRLIYRPEQLEFGQCALDWYKDSHENYHKNKLVALISAGMTTGSDKKYVTDTVQTLDKLGYEVVVFIRRGVGGLKLSSTRFFSPSKWRDFEAAILSVRKQRPDAHLVSIGFSFGSIELCRYLAMKGSKSLVDAALLVSCPFDPEAGGRNMRKRALNRRIDAYLAKNLGKQLHQALSTNNNTDTNNNRSSENQTQLQKLEFCNLNGSVVDLASLPKIKSLVDFEDNYNRVIQNYPNSDAYAADSRLSEHLGNIKTPTLCLSSEDDFMAPIRLLPIEQIEANKNLCMILTKRGGHMAFIDGILWPKKPYFAQRIISKYMLAIRKSFLLSDRKLTGRKVLNSSSTTITIPIASSKPTTTNSQPKRPRVKLSKVSNNDGQHNVVNMVISSDVQRQTMRSLNHHKQQQNVHCNRKESDNFLNMFDE